MLVHTHTVVEKFVALIVELIQAGFGCCRLSTPVFFWRADPVLIYAGCCRINRRHGVGVARFYLVDTVGPTQKQEKLGMSAIIKTKLKAARDALGKKDFAKARDAAEDVLSYEADNYNA